MSPRGKPYRSHTVRCSESAAPPYYLLWERKLKLLNKSGEVSPLCTLGGQYATVCDCREPAGEDNVIICMNSSDECACMCMSSNLWLSMMCKKLKPRQVGHFIDTHTLRTRKHTLPWLTYIPTLQPLEGCTRSRDNPEDWSGLLQGEYQSGHLFHLPLQSVLVLLKSSQIRSTPSSVLTHQTLTHNEGYNYCLSLCNRLLFSYVSPPSPHFLRLLKWEKRNHHKKQMTSNRKSICVTA